MRNRISKYARMLGLVLCLTLSLESVAFAAGNPAEKEQEAALVTVEEGEMPGSVEGEVSGGGTESGEPEETPVVKLEENYEVRWLADKMSYIYTGEEIRPEVAVCSRADGAALDPRFYEVSYENNTNVGTAKVVVTGIEEQGYTGSLAKEFTITKKALKDTKFSYSKTCYYTGKDVKSPVTIKDGSRTLVLNTDYTVSYSNCKEIGTAKLKVTGKGNYTGTLSGSYSIKLGKVAISKISAVTYNQIKLTWNKVPGASGYKVYRSTKSGGSYSLIKTITSGSTVSYTNTGLTNGRTYYYKVIAYRTVKGVKKYSPYSPVKSQRAQVAQAGMSSVKAKNYSSVVVSWKKVPYANGYTIYRSTSKDGSYKSVGYTKTALSYTDAKCTTGVTYYYKVRAYRYNGKTKYYGLASSAMSGKAVPNKVSVSSSSKAYADKVNLVWAKVSGASGYEVYRKAKNEAEYTLVKTLSGNSSVKCTDAGLEKEEYYYKVRAYRTVNGKKVYGSFSSVFTKYSGGWRYVNGYKLYYDENGKLVKDVRKIIGKQSSYEIRVNKQMSCVTVYAKDGNNGYIIPVVAFACSPGSATPTGTFYTPQKYRWRELYGAQGQWCTRITGHVLFHSPPYSRFDNHTLWAKEYNKLGTWASAGCVRLRSGDAKWIYDNCKLKTKVKIYNSSNAGPLGKPKYAKIPLSQNWDPTDPTV